MSKHYNNNILSGISHVLGLEKVKYTQILSQSHKSREIIFKISVFKNKIS